MNPFFEIPLRPKKNAGALEELYQEAWDLIITNIQKLATDKGSIDIIVRYLLDAKSYGFGMSEPNQLKFMTDEYPVVVTTVFNHWFEVVSTLEHRQLSSIATGLGYTIKKPVHTAVDVVNTKREMPFWLKGNQLVGIIRSETPKLKLIDESETDIDELSDEDKTIVSDIIKTGLCACSVCEAVRKGTKPTRKKKTSFKPDEPLKLEEFTSLSKAMRSPERVESLYLNNQEIDSLPEDINKMVNLTSLYAGETQINSLPKEITKCKTLNTLTVNSTLITELPESIDELINLEFLDVSKTPLKSIPGSLTRLPKLRWLDLGYCEELKQPLPNLGAITTLERLLLTNVPASKDAIDFSTLQSLNELWLRNTNLTTLPESMRHLISLKLLTLNDNPLNELPDWLSGLINLENLELWGCKLKSIPEVIFTLPHLSVLSLSENPIESLDGIGQCKTLSDLRITGCHAINRLPEDIGELTNLTQLFLDYTSISDLPDSIGNLSKLQHISLNNTKLKTLPSTIGDLKELTTMYIDDTPVNELPPTMAKLTKLERIVIRKTQITKIPDWLIQLPALTRIDISDDQLDATEISRVRKANGNITLSIG